MTLVDAATKFSANAETHGALSLQEWALSKSTVVEQLAAIELVLAHDFDEPSASRLTGSSHETGQRVREEFLIEVTGVARGSQTTTVRRFGDPADAGVRHRAAA